jgi:hypothetical protein
MESSVANIDGPTAFVVFFLFLGVAHLIIAHTTHSFLS